MHKEVEHRYLFIGLFLIVAVLCFLMVKPYFSFIVISLILAYLLSPLQHRLRKFVRADVAATCITLGVLVVLVTPLFFLIKLVLLESSSIYQSSTLASLNNLLATYLSDQYREYAKQVIQTGIGGLLTSISHFLFSVPQKLVGLLIGIITLFFALRDMDKIENMFRRYLPVEDKYKDRIINHFKETIDAVTYSTILVALLQGFMGALGYFLFGIKTPLLWGVVTAVAAVLPFIGPMVVWLPLSIYLYLTVSPFKGIGLALYGGVLLSLVLEVFVKNRMIANKGKIHTLIAILGVLGGLPLFGVSGLILGPFLLTIFMLLLEVLFGEKHEAQS